MNDIIELVVDYYYIGNQLTVENEDDACTADLLGTTSFDKLCSYNENTFDVIISESCPANNGIGIFTENNMKTIKSILKPNGFLFLIGSMHDTALYDIGSKTNVSIVPHMVHEENYKYLEKFKYYHSFAFGLEKGPIRERFMYIFQNQKKKTIMFSQ